VATTITKIVDLSCELDERGASISIHNSRDEWVVWLYAPDDPGAAFFRTRSDDLRRAIELAFSAWDAAGGATLS
jgi:hypothetical protein